MKTLADLPSTSAAMAALGLVHPLIATRIATMPAVEDPERTSSIATDGETIFVDPEFLRTRDEAECTYMLAFMGLMLVDDFLARRGERHHAVWSTACNISLHNQLAEAGVERRPAHADDLYDPALKGLIADEIYERLMDGRKLMYGKHVLEWVGEPDTMQPA